MTRILSFGSCTPNHHAHQFVVGLQDHGSYRAQVLKACSVAIVASRHGGYSHQMHEPAYASSLASIRAQGRTEVGFSPESLSYAGLVQAYAGGVSKLLKYSLGFTSLDVAASHSLKAQQLGRKHGEGRQGNGNEEVRLSVATKKKPTLPRGELRQSMAKMEIRRQGSISGINQKYSGNYNCNNVVRIGIGQYRDHAGKHNTAAGNTVHHYVHPVQCGFHFVQVETKRSRMQVRFLCE